MTRTPLIATIALIVAGTGAAVGAPAATADSADAKPKATTVAKGLLSPLSIAVTKKGTLYYSQNFMGMLFMKAPGKAAVPVYQGKPKEEVGAVSETGGAVKFAVTGKKQRLMTWGGDGKAVVQADLGKFEKTENPDAGVTYGFQTIDAACLASIPEQVPGQYTGIIESHPYATTTHKGVTYVADAAGNDIVAVTGRGKVSALAVLPPVPFVMTAEVAEGNGLPACTVGLTYNFEPVPTDVEVGPDGKLYVSTLTGGPEDGSTGAQSKVYQVNRKTGAVELVAEGLVGAVGVAVAESGDIYVSQLYSGQLARIKEGTNVATPYFATALPGDVEWSPSGLYLTANVLSGTSGEKNDPPKGKILSLK